MALVIKDRIKETSTTTGTGTLTLAGASTGFKAFSEIGSGNTTYYAISDGTDWEVGLGTVGSGTLSRDTILASSNAGSAVSWNSDVKDVFCTYPADKAVYEQAGGLVDVPSLAINGTTVTATAAELNYVDGVTSAIQTQLNDKLESGDTAASLTITSADINGGTIDGVTIGGSSAGAITGTTITGTSFVTSGDMTFGDNDKAIFGAGSDLQIYHDGSESYIDEVGTGSLSIRTNGSGILLETGTGYGVRALTGGQTDLWHNGNLKLATTSTGIDVTGTVTADGLTVGSSGTVLINATSRNLPSVGIPQVQLEGSGTGASTVLVTNTANDATPSAFALLKARGTSAVQINDELGRISFNGWDGSQEQESASISTFIDTYPGTADMPGRLVFKTSPNASATPLERMRISNGGDISFYEDTGTTPKFFWDASAESLGIGTSSPSKKLHSVVSSSGSLETALALQNANAVDGTETALDFSSNTSFVATSRISSARDGSGLHSLRFSTYNLGLSERMRIDSSGRVGIGTSNPSNPDEGAGLQVRKYIDRVQYYSPAGSYAGSFGYTDNTNTKTWISVDSSYNQGSAVSAGLFLSAWHGDANGSTIGYTMKNNRSDQSLAWSRVTSATSVGVSATETEFMRIDSSGRVGIGTSSPATVLELAAATNTNKITFDPTNTGSNGDILGGFVAENDGAVGQVAIRRESSTTNSYISFESRPTGGALTERMRIDSSGNVLVGTTSANPTSSGVNTPGQELSATGGVRSTVDSNPAATFNRKTDDGSIVLFRKNGTTVGSIDVDSGYLTFSNGAVKIGDAANGQLLLLTATNSATPRLKPDDDNAVDLGDAAGRFKNLYLSGGIYLGGTGAANYLDDYEEGTWTPTLQDHSGNQGTLDSSSGYYCKVGNQVTLWMNINLSNKSSMTGSVWVSSLPFSIKDILSTTGNDGIGAFGQFGNLSTGVSWLGLRANQVNGIIEVTFSPAAGSTVVNNLTSYYIGDNFTFRAMFTYVTT